MMRSDQHRLLADARLSREARLMGLYLSETLGEVEVSTEDWQLLLGVGPRGLPKRQSIAAHISELELFGYVRKRPGGAGAPRYHYLLQSPQGTVADPTVPSGDGSPFPATVPPGDGRNPTVPSGDILQSPQGTVEPPPPPPPNPPPPPPPLDPLAEAAIEREGEHLNGCRGALRDYLEARVAPEHQHAYAMTVLGWVHGTNEAVWADAHGAHLQTDRTKVLADALNQLRAGNEVGTYFPGPPGDVRNLAKKIRYLVRAILGARRDATRNGTPDHADPHSSGAPAPPRGQPKGGARQPGRFAGATHRKRDG